MRSDPGTLAAILRKDLYTFVQAAFPVVSPGTPFLPNWHIEAMTSVLAEVLDGNITRLIITVPPRHLKSLCASIAFPAFALGADPTRQIVCVSYSDNLARNLANSCRTLMRSELYQRVFPNTRIGKDTELEITTTARGSRFATSVGGTLTGRGGSIIVLDDPLKPQDAYSESARENVRQWYSNTLMSRLNNKSTDAIIVVMQRLHVDDLVGHLRQQEDWYHLNLPAIVDVDGGEYLKSAFGDWRLHRRKAGEALHPAREPKHVLDAIKREMGSLDFSAQYLQQPVRPEGNLVKWKWFGAYDDPPAYKTGDRIIVSWDTAMSAKELASYSVGIVIHARGDSVWVLDVVRERMEYPDLKRKVVSLHRRWSQTGSNYTLLIENKASGLGLIQELKHDDIHALAIDPEGDKIFRMNAQTARIEAGCVSLPRKAHWLDEFRRELSAFPSSPHNDQVDAFSQGLNEVFNPLRRGCSAVGFYNIY
jgi:predicted phage terminase large subunit-like protein